MKTIEQREHRDIHIDYDEERFYIHNESDGITVEKESISQLIQALLPEGKAIIDVPQFEEYEYVRYGYAVKGEYCIDSFGKIMEWVLTEKFKSLSFIYRKKPEPFLWPEHLPDGTELLKTRRFNRSQDDWCLGFGSVPSPIDVDYYNEICRPEDRITIPDWLEREPRTLVKGEK